MELIPATGDVLDQILDESFELWGSGLSREGYGRYNAAQLAIPWGAAHLERLALVERGHVLSSAKRYHLQAHFDGRLLRVIGIGALFTPPAERGRGHAHALLRRMLDDARAAGADLALLFSEIAPSFYRPLGFQTAPVEETILDLEPRPGAPGIVIRSGNEREMEAVARMHGELAAGYRFALHRPAEWVRYGIRKKRLLAGLGPAGLRAVEFFLAEEGGRAVAYVVIVATGEGWYLEEFGDRDPTGARVGALLQALRARSPATPPPVTLTWLPPRLVLPQTRIVATRPAREILMMASLREDLDIQTLTADDVLYWHGDTF